MKIKDLFSRDNLPAKLQNAARLLSEDVQAPDYVPDDPAELAEYTGRTKNFWQAPDPITAGQTILTDMDLKTIATICYRILKIGGDQEDVMSEGNALRELFYLGRMALKYPKETADDPKYQEALEHMVGLYNSMEDTAGYDAISDGFTSPHLQ